MTDLQTSGIRWFALIAVLFLAFVVKPVVGASFGSEMTRLALYEVAMVGAIFVCAENKMVRAVGLIVALLWLATSVAALLGMDLGGAVAALATAVTLGAIGVTFSFLFRSGKGKLETLLGAIFGYLFLAMAWAVLFVQIERWRPGSFLFPAEADLWSALLYYSMVTVTTLGYGDITPVTGFAQLAAGFEAIFGVLYIAVFVGSIVGSFNEHRSI